VDKTPSGKRGSVKPLLTKRTGPNTITFGWYDRLLHWALYRLDWYIEQRSNRQWDSLRWTETADV